MSNGVPNPSEVVHLKFPWRGAGCVSKSAVSHQSNKNKGARRNLSGRVQAELCLCDLMHPLSNAG